MASCDLELFTGSDINGTNVPPVDLNELKEFQLLENDVCHTVVLGNVAAVVGCKWLMDQMCSK